MHVIVFAMNDILDVLGIASNVDVSLLLYKGVRSPKNDVLDKLGTITELWQ